MKKNTIWIIHLSFLFHFQGPFETQFCSNSWPASIQNVRFDERFANKKAGKLIFISMIFCVYQLINIEKEFSKNYFEFGSCNSTISIISIQHKLRQDYNVKNQPKSLFICNKQKLFFLPCQSFSAKMSITDLS